MAVKVFQAALSTFELFQSGALIFANYLLQLGLSQDEVIAKLQERYPAQDPLDLQYVVDLTLQGQQAGAELSDLPPGFANPPSGIPVVPGVSSGGYIVNIPGLVDENGNQESIRRQIDSDTPLSYDELLALASKDLAEIIKKYPDQFVNRGLTLGQLTDIEVQLAWFKGS